jgi:hypothetical protein
MPGHRETEQEIARRVELIYQPVLNGLREPNIREYLRQRGEAWADTISRAQLHVYMRRALDLQANAANQYRRARLSQALCRMDDAYALARSQQNVRGCVAVTDRIIKLLRLDKPIEVDVEALLDDLDRALEERERDALKRKAAKPRTKRVAPDTE